MSLNRLKFYLFVCLLSLSYSSLSNAHAVVTETSLSNTIIKSGHAEQITISYNARIEQGLSKIFLVSKGDKQMPLQFKKSTKPGQIQVQIPEIMSGDYALLFKVFSTDGHLSEDLVHFQVK